MSDWYTLADDGKTPLKTDDYSRKIPEEHRRVGDTEAGDARVSTVFLSMDHRYEGDPDPRPVLWETMVFGGPLEGFQGRYRTYAEAVAGHAAMVERVKAAPDLQRRNRGQRFYEAFMDTPSWRQLSDAEKGLYMDAAERFLNAESEADL